MAVNRKKIMGPPGTGKTHRLVHHYLNKELNELHTDPKRIAYVTFSTAASLDGSKKIQDVFPGVELLYISTLHAVGKRELEIPKKQILTGAKWKQFKNVYPIYSDINFDSYVNEYGQTVTKNKNLEVTFVNKVKEFSYSPLWLKYPKKDFLPTII